jgi:hypothetical protein
LCVVYIETTRADVQHAWVSMRNMVVIACFGAYSAGGRFDGSNKMVLQLKLLV